ncbi:hypothetical protein HDU79_007799 [Rhizoclosmatium sp. JEL0117]|nr:hypothetical protein HDU79_007799 [Rhizoclosmatium sp. JEL0117]
MPTYGHVGRINENNDYEPNPEHLRNNGSVTTSTSSLKNADYVIKSMSRSDSRPFSRSQLGVDGSGIGLDVSSNKPLSSNPVSVSITKSERGETISGTFITDLINSGASSSKGSEPVSSIAGVGFSTSVPQTPKKIQSPAACPSSPSLPRSGTTIPPKSIDSTKPAKVTNETKESLQNAVFRTAIFPSLVRTNSSTEKSKKKLTPIDSYSTTSESSIQTMDLVGKGSGSRPATSIQKKTRTSSANSIRSNADEDSEMITSLTDSRPNSYVGSSASGPGLVGLEIHGNLKMKQTPVLTAGSKATPVNQSKPIQLWKPAGSGSSPAKAVDFNASGQAKDLSDREKAKLLKAGTRTVQGNEQHEEPDLPLPPPSMSPIISRSMNIDPVNPATRRPRNGETSRILPKPGPDKDSQPISGMGILNQPARNTSSITSISDRDSIMTAGRPSAEAPKKLPKQKTISHKGAKQLFNLLTLHTSKDSRNDAPVDIREGQSTVVSSVQESLRDDGTCLTTICESSIKESSIRESEVQILPKSPKPPLGDLIKTGKREKVKTHAEFLEDLRAEGELEVPMRPPEPVFTVQQLEKMMLADYTFLEKRSTDIQINRIHQNMKDMTVVANLKIEFIEWPRLRDMAYTLFKYHTAIQCMADPYLMQLVVETMEEDSFSDEKRVMELKRLFGTVSKKERIFWKMAFSHLERICTSLNDIPAPLYKPFAGLFSTALFRFPSRHNKKYRQEQEERHKKEQEEAEAAEAAENPGLLSPGLLSPHGASPAAQRRSPRDSSGGVIRDQKTGGALVKGLWDEDELTERPKPRKRGLSINTLAKGNFGAGTQSHEKVRGFRNEIARETVFQPPAAIIIPENSPFSPNSKAEEKEAEAEFERWFASKDVKKEFKLENERKMAEHEAEMKKEKMKEKMLEEMKKEKKKQREREALQERGRYLWAKVRNWVLTIGAAKLADKLFEGYARAMKEIQEEIGNSSEAAKIIQEGIIIKGQVKTDPDGFGWTFFRKEDLDAKIFLEETVPTATSAALELILKNLNTIL